MSSIVLLQSRSYGGYYLEPWDAKDLLSAQPVPMLYFFILLLISRKFAAVTRIFHLQVLERGVSESTKSMLL